MAESAQLGQDLDEIGRQRRLERQLDTRDRVGEGEPVGVEEGPADNDRSPRAAVAGVTRNGMTDSGEMNSDLMSTSSEEIDFEERILVMIISLTHETCFSNFRIDGVMYSHPLSIIGISPDIGLDIPFMIFYFSYYECEVRLADRALGDLELE